MPHNCVTIFNVRNAPMVQQATLPCKLGQSDGAPADLMLVVQGEDSLCIHTLREGFVCMEDLRRDFPITEEMEWIIGHMSKGPVIKVRPGPDGSLVISQKNVETTFVGGRVEIGRGAEVRLPGCQHYKIDVTEDILKTISRKHALLERRAEGWVLCSHPLNPSDLDLARERSTWMKLDANTVYPTPTGVRDGSVAVMFKNITPEVSCFPVLVKGCYSGKSVQAACTRATIRNALSGESLCSLQINSLWKGGDLISLVSEELQAPPAQISLLAGGVPIYADTSLAAVIGEDAFGATDDGGEGGVSISLVRKQDPVAVEVYNKIEAQGPSALWLAPEELLADRAFMGMAVVLCGHAIAYASDALLRDRALQLSAINTTPSAIHHFAHMATVDVWKYALGKDKSLAVYAPRTILRDPEVAVLAL